MKKKYLTTILAILIAASAAALLAFYFAPVTYSEDEVCNGLIKDIAPRAALAVAVACLAVLCGYGGAFRLRLKGALRAAAWTVPCFAVALANFPYSALISGQAQILRPDLIGLFILKCLFIALSEEILFRVIILQFTKETLKGRAHGYVLCVLISSAIFSLFHILNLLEGAGIGATALQVGYTFLTGMMFASMTLRTENVWSAVLAHCLFDIGGLIVTDLGEGPFQDGIFWALTAVAAAICAVHLILYALRRDRQESTENTDETP